MLRSWDVWASGASKRNIKLYPPSHYHLQILYRQDIYAHFKANIYVLQSESPPPSLPKNTHTHTTNPSLATLPGWSDNTWHGFMASWPLQWDAWIQTRSTHTLFRPCAFFAFLLELGLGEKGNKPHNRNQLAQRQPFCYSLSAHTSVGARERGRRLWETQGVW